MWYEILPCMAIVGTALAAPEIALYYLHNFVLGTPYRRALYCNKDRITYLRDNRLTGSVYKVAGLESIKDE